MEIVDKNVLVFSTGKRVDTNGGIVGLSPDGKVTHGYDGPLFDPDVDNFEEFTSAELVELADYMSEKWKQFGKAQKCTLVSA